MTEPQKHKKSRRRFLADMLFLGGGVTAAALLAKSEMMPWQKHPQVAGNMMVAPLPQDTPQVTAPMPGEPMPVETPRSCDPNPAVDGDYSLPTERPEVKTKGDFNQPSPPPPQTGGKPLPPQTPPRPQES